MDQPLQQAALQPYLLPDERILWTGRPDPRRLFAVADLWLVPFSLLWGGFALVWESLVFTSGAPWFFILWGVPFVVVGQYFIWGRFLYKRWDRGRTAYAVTNRRIIVLKGRRLQAVSVNPPPQINQSTGRGGEGTLAFGTTPFGYGVWANTGMDWFYRQAAPVAFYDIPDVNNVYRVVASAASG